MHKKYIESLPLTLAAKTDELVKMKFHFETHFPDNLILNPLDRRAGKFGHAAAFTANDVVVMMNLIRKFIKSIALILEAGP